MKSRANHINIFPGKEYLSVATIDMKASASQPHVVRLQNNLTKLTLP